MVKREIKTERTPKPMGPHPQGLVAGSRLYVSGQGPMDAEKRRMPVGIAAQTRQVMTNLRNIIEAGGGAMDGVAKCTVYLANLSDFEEFNGVYMEFFREPYPACTAVGGALIGGVLVVVDAIVEL
jgi:2-iminobutanoate/2-iminopropanoate deaminase